VAIIQPVDLSATEFRLLHALMSHAPLVLSKEQLLDLAWDYESSGNKSRVETYISYLRKKIDGGGPSLIRTSPRFGYGLREETSSRSLDEARISAQSARGAG
jgi:two-component system OmpR family response regulator